MIYEKLIGFFEQIDILLSKLVLIENMHHIQDSLKALARIIHQSPFKIANPEVLSSKENQIFISAIKLLLSLIIDKKSPAETTFLSSTCVSLFLTKLFSEKFTSYFLICLYSYIGEESLPDEIRKDSNTDDYLHKIISHCIQQQVQANKSHLMEVLNEKVTLLIESNPTFQQLSFIHGIVSCHDKDLFSYKLYLFRNFPFLILLFKPIYQYSLVSRATQFHGFNILLNWAKMCQRTFDELYLDEDNSLLQQLYFEFDSYIIQKALYLLESNWESPIQGVTGFVRVIYKVFIQLNEQEIKKFDLSKPNLASFLSNKIMKYSWKVKGKYLLLSVILPFLDYKKFIEQYPDFCSTIISHINVTYASSSVSEVYKVLFFEMKKTSAFDVFYNEWDKLWKTPIIQALCSNDKLLKQNIVNLILPWTMKNFPESYHLLVETADQKHNKNEIHILLMRLAKEAGIISIEKQEINTIKQNLHHNNIFLRMEIISLLCSSPKKSQSLSRDELQLIKEFIEINMNIDNAAFLQRLLAQLRILLIRIRDSCVQSYRLNVLNNNFAVTLSQIEFVDWLAYTCFKNTFPGSCYQRRKFCLEVLNIIFDVFIIAPLGTKKKEKPSESVKEFISWSIKEHHHLSFFEANTFLKILPCIADFSEEIRLLTSNFIRNYCIWPISNNDFIEFMNNNTISNYIPNNVSDIRNNESSALLCSLTYFQLCIKDKKFNTYYSLTYLQEITEKLRIIVNSIKNEPPSAKVLESLHGNILSLQYCMTNSDEFLIKFYHQKPNEVVNVFQDIIEFCDTIVLNMLSLMKGNDQNDKCPSFAKIGQSLENLIISTHENYDADICLSFQNELETDTLNSNLNLSFESNQLLLWCWHCIKDSCFLLTEMSSLFKYRTIPPSLKKHLIKDIARILSSTLVICRHRGVVDACSLALNKFLKNLHIDLPLYEETSMDLLNLGFSILTNTHEISVTRRSAGLSSYFQALISSECNTINRKLLPFAIKKLLKVMQNPLPLSFNDKTDLPQANTYHILKALLADSSLSQEILSFLDDITPLCISGFSSQYWPIRNGALQLFGVLLPRLCGQKKVHDDYSEHNLISFSELFSRCPSLKSYLLKQLNNSIALHYKGKLCPELVPVLSVLVKVLPQQEEIENLRKDFKPLLWELLDIPVWNIRNLISSALSLLMRTSEVLNLIGKMKNILKYEVVNCNRFHTLLLLVQKIVKRSLQSLDVSILASNLTELYCLLNERINCYILHGLILDIIALIPNEYYCDIALNLHVSFEYSEKHIGFHFLAAKKFLLKLKTCSDNEIPNIIKDISHYDLSVQKSSLYFLFSRLLYEKNDLTLYKEANLSLWQDIVISLVKFIEIGKHPSIVMKVLKFFIELCSNWDTKDFILNEKIIILLERNLQSHLEGQSGLSVAAFSFTVWTLCLKVKLSRLDLSWEIESWISLFTEYSQPRSPDILRMQAAESIALFGAFLFQYLESQMNKNSKLASNFLISLCDSSLLLLQDEDEEIRNKTCQFPSNIPHSYDVGVVQFNKAIQILCLSLSDVLKCEETFIIYLWNKFQNYPSTAKLLLSLNDIRKKSIFEQEYVNVYSEPIQLLLCHEKQLLKVLELLKLDIGIWQEKLEMFICDTLNELEESKEIIILNDNKGNMLDHQVFLALKKLHSQVKIISSQESFIPSTLKLNYDKIINTWSLIKNSLSTTLCWFLYSL